MYVFINLRRSKYSIHDLCITLKVSESGYYRSLKHTDKIKEDLLLAQIKAIISQHPENDNYGTRRIHIALSQMQQHVSFSTVYRTMRKHQMLKKAKRHPNGITREDTAAQKSENIIQRDFSAAAPNQKWLTDITEVQCSDGKLYVAPILDCFNGEIVGLAMDNNMRKELCIQAFENACKSQKAKGMILHSDRGSQFTSYEYRKILTCYNAIQSMSGTGRCYDNARMESFFATLKKEKLYRIGTERFPMAQIKSVIFRYIMVYYNKQRIYTSNPQGLPPFVYRMQSTSNSKVA